MGRYTDIALTIPHAILDMFCLQWTSHHKTKDKQYNGQKKKDIKKKKV